MISYLGWSYLYVSSFTLIFLSYRRSPVLEWQLHSQRGLSLLELASTSNPVQTTWHRNNILCHLGTHWEGTSPRCTTCCSLADKTEGLKRWLRLHSGKKCLLVKSDKFFYLVLMWKGCCIFVFCLLYTYTATFSCPL